MLKTHEVRARVPEAQWPAGRRFCSGCQFMVPKWYTDDSKCRACASESRYGAHILETYGITYDFYLALYQFQGGRCYICRKVPKTRRLAVDHDHSLFGPDSVRGLLCSGERSCNHDILGNITGIEMAQRIVIYLGDPPARAMREGRDLPDEVATAGASMLGGKARTVRPAEQAAGQLEVMQKMAAQSIEARARRARDREYSDGDFWRFPKDHDGPLDIFHAVPDALDPKAWEKRLELARTREDEIAAARARG
jgi:hypothetical protein